jgi:two-component system response regulator DesR
MKQPNPLNEKETEIVQHLSMGKPAKEIARDLAVKEGSIRQYTKLAIRVAGVKNATGLVAKSLREGWIK